jgi:hypothetical protein
MSLLKFKCHECGHDIKKIRAAKDIIFDFSKKRPLVCKHCGCKYKISAIANWIAVFLMCLIFIPICFLTAFSIAYQLVTTINSFFEVKVDGLWFLLSAFIFLLLELFVGVHLISSMLPLKKLEEKE